MPVNPPHPHPQGAACTSQRGRCASSASGRKVTRRKCVFFLFLSHYATDTSTVERRSSGDKDNSFDISAEVPGPNLIYRDWGSAEQLNLEPLASCRDAELQTPHLDSPGKVPSVSVRKKKKGANGRRKEVKFQVQGQFCWFQSTSTPPSGLAVTVHQGDDENRDVVAGAQALVGDPPPSVPQHAAGAHHQVLRRHCVPATQER